MMFTSFRTRNPGFPLRRCFILVAARRAGVRRGASPRRESRAQRIAARSPLRLPQAPLVVESPSGQTGQYGGDIVTLVPRPRDIRYISTFAYTRLIGYDRDLDLKPDILEAVENVDDRIFTFTLRAGHRWSDGAPFTAEDFRYYWDDVANNLDLSPAGPSRIHDRGRQAAEVRSPGRAHVRYTWDHPNPRFLPQLAGPVDPGIYRPAHYLKKFHANYADKAKLEEEAKAQKLKSWAALHNRVDDMKEQTNPDLPVLMPWRVTTRAPANALHLRAQSLLSPGRHGRGSNFPMSTASSWTSRPAAFSRRKPMRARSISCSAACRMSDIPVLKQGEKMPRLQDAAVALCARIRTRALSQPQCDGPGLARAEP